MSTGLQARGVEPPDCRIGNAPTTRLGPSSITVTMDVYGHLFSSLAEALTERLDDGFREARASHVDPTPPRSWHCDRPMDETAPRDEPKDVSS